MAVQSRKFWVATVIQRDDPPKSWTRVIACRLPDHATPAIESEVIDRAMTWLRRDELAGSFCWVTAEYGSHGATIIDGYMFAFSDPNTAFAFKMRFG